MYGACENTAGPAPSTDWREDWNAGYGVGTGFPSPAEVNWVYLDGTEHHAEIDIGALFKTRLVRHNVPKEDRVCNLNRVTAL